MGINRLAFPGEFCCGQRRRPQDQVVAAEAIVARHVVTHPAGHEASLHVMGDGSSGFIDIEVPNNSESRVRR